MGFDCNRFHPEGVRMKKLLLIFVALFATVSLQAKGLEDVNGEDWATMLPQVKTAFVSGFLISCITVIENFKMTLKDVQTDSAKTLLKAVIDQYFYQQNIGQIITLVDKVYSNPDNLQYGVWSVIPYVCGKKDVLQFEDQGSGRTSFQEGDS
jgi:hypothetical protein